MAGRVKAALGFCVAALPIATALSCTKTPPEPGAGGALVSEPARSSLAPATTAAGSKSASPLASARCIREMVAAPAASVAGDACPKDPRPQTFPTASLEFLESTGGPRTITVELARTREETARGLMYRRAMPDDRGMLFDLHVRKVQAFWMQNTCIPLDMLFVEEDGLIVGILEQVPVLNEVERTVGCPSRYVLEVNAGFCRKHGIKPGQKLKLPQ